MSVTGPRLLDKVLSGCAITTGEIGGECNLVAGVGGGGWEKLDGETFVYRSYFDISGYNLEQLTAFIQRVQVQEEFGPYGLMPAYIIDIVGVQSIEDNEITTAHITRATSPDDLPGFSLSAYNMEQIIYARNRHFATAVTNLGSPQVVALKDVSTWGTGTSTAGAKMYVTRIVYTDPNFTEPLHAIIVPPCNYVIALVVGEESEQSWMMNIRRSFEQEPR